MPTHAPRAALPALALAALAACGGGSGPPDDDPELVAIGTQNATGFAGNFAPVLPTVQVRNAAGAAVPGVTVTFAVSQGGGTVAFPTAVSDAQGRASVGAWRFGGAGPQALTATAPGYASATITATATTVPASTFDIDLRFLDPQPTDEQRAAFEAARARWRQVVVGDVADFTGSIPAEPCGADFTLPAVTSPVDDVIMFAGVQDIDGDGGILAQAGPCIVRGSNRLTIIGIVLFDSSDLDILTTGASFADVAFHEMAHVLGFGTTWTDLSLLTGAGTTDPFFTGAGARQAFRALQLPENPFTGNSVPVEATGGAGTRDGHWRESVFDNEILTGFYDGGASNLLSAVSIASLRDMGYVVDDTRAEAYALPPSFAVARLAGPTVEFRESLAPWPIVAVDDAGRPISGQSRR